MIITNKKIQNWLNHRYGYKVEISELPTYHTKTFEAKEKYLKGVGNIAYRVLFVSNPVINTVNKM